MEFQNEDIQTEGKLLLVVFMSNCKYPLIYNPLSKLDSNNIVTITIQIIVFKYSNQCQLLATL